MTSQTIGSRFGFALGALTMAALVASYQHFLRPSPPPAQRGGQLPPSLSISEQVEPGMPDHGLTKRQLHDEYLRLYARRKYATLVATLPPGIADESMQRLWAVLESRELALNGSREDATGAGGSDAAALERQKEAFRRQIDELGPPLGETVNRYLATFAQRQIIDDINQQLFYRNDCFSLAQIEQLARLLHENEITSPKRPATPQDIDAFIRRREEACERIMAAVRPLVSGTQREVLASHLALQVAFLKSQRDELIRMAGRDSPGA